MERNMTKTKIVLGTLFLALTAADALLTPFIMAPAPAAETMAASADVGKPAPEFTLTNTSEKEHALSEYKGKFVVLEWNNPDCPFVKKHYDYSHNMQDLQRKYTKKGVIWLSINS